MERYMMSAVLGFIPGMSGPWEIILILFVVLLLFGSRRLPDLARSMGKSMSEFKKGKEEGASEGAKPSPERSPELVPDNDGKDSGAEDQ